MRHLFNHPLGACSAPFGFSRKESGIGAAALAAGIAATASTVNNAMSNYAADLTSDRQFYRTQDLMDKEQQQRKDLFDYQNAYGTPEAIMQRYRDAGLNPFLNMREGSIGSGQTPSVPSAGGAPSVPLGQTFPLDVSSTVSSLSEMLVSSSSIERNESESFKSIIDSLPVLGEYLGEDEMRNVARSLLASRGVDLSSDKGGSRRLNQLDDQIDLLKLQKENQFIQNRLDSLTFDIQDKYGSEKARLLNDKLDKEVSKLQEEILKIGSERDVNDMQVYELWTRSARNLAEELHLNADTNTINKLRDALYWKAKGDSNSAYSRGMMDFYDSQDRAARFKADRWQRQLDELVSKDDKDLSPSQKVLKKAVLAERRLGRVAKNISPLNP